MRETQKKFRKDMEINDFGIDAFVRKAQKAAQYDKKHNHVKTSKKRSSKPRHYEVFDYDYSY